METTQINEQPKIRKKFERETALKILNEIKDKIGGVDLDSICNEGNEITENDLDDFNTRRLVQAIQCELVYWDETENCLVQKLTTPLKCGELNALEFRYKHKLSILQLKENNTSNQIELIMRIMSQITGRPMPLIGKLFGVDMEIAMGCVSFFGK